MSIIGDPVAQNFADVLLQIGNGSIFSQNADESINVDMIGNNALSFKELKDVIFPDVRQYF